jgi:hypothetical protein
VILFWEFRDFTLSLCIYKSFYGNVLDNHGFLFEFVDLHESMRYCFGHLGTLL